jgi:hypothetical protein
MKFEKIRNTKTADNAFSIENITKRNVGDTEKSLADN